MKLRKREDRKLRATKAEIKHTLSLLEQMRDAIARLDSLDDLDDWQCYLLALRISRLLTMIGEVPTVERIEEIWQQLDTVEECMRSAGHPVFDEPDVHAARIRFMALNLLVMASCFEEENGVMIWKRHPYQ